MQRLSLCVYLVLLQLTLDATADSVGLIDRISAGKRNLAGPLFTSPVVVLGDYGVGKNVQQGGHGYQTSSSTSNINGNDNTVSQDQSQQQVGGYSNSQSPQDERPTSPGSYSSNAPMSASPSNPTSLLHSDSGSSTGNRPPSGSQAQGNAEPQNNVNSGNNGNNEESRSAPLQNYGSEGPSLIQSGRNEGQQNLDQTQAVGGTTVDQGSTKEPSSQNDQTSLIEPGEAPQSNEAQQTSSGLPSVQEQQNSFGKKVHTSHGQAPHRSKVNVGKYMKTAHQKSNGQASKLPTGARVAQSGQYNSYSVQQSSNVPPYQQSQPPPQWIPQQEQPQWNGQYPPPSDMRSSFQQPAPGPAPLPMIRRRARPNGLAV